GALGQPASFAGVSLAVFAAGEVLALLFSGRLADSRGRKPLVIIGLSLLAAGTVLLGQAGQPLFFLLASLLAGLGAGTFSPAQSATVADLLGPKARGGSVLAGVQMATDVGTIVGPLVAGVIADRLSFTAAFWLSGAVGVLGVLIWLTATETLPRQGSEAAEEAAGDCQSPEHPR
ncbi:MAG: MFS transporter, partial [Sciscionella sp.]